MRYSWTELSRRSTRHGFRAGRVVELPVDVGDSVKKGDLILRLTAVEQKPAPPAPRHNLPKPKLSTRACGDMLSKKLIAQADFDKAEAAFKTASSPAPGSGIEGAANTAVYAPYSGLVVSRHIKLGRRWHQVPRC